MKSLGSIRKIMRTIICALYQTITSNNPSPASSSASELSRQGVRAAIRFTRRECSNSPRQVLLRTIKKREEIFGTVRSFKFPDQEARQRRFICGCLIEVDCDVSRFGLADHHYTHHRTKRPRAVGGQRGAKA